MSGQQPPNIWDFINSFDPNNRAAPGRGVDHNEGPPSFPSGFFPFLGGPHGPPPHHGRGRPQPPGAWPWGADTDFDDWNPWVYHGPRGRRGGRHGHRWEGNCRGRDNNAEQAQEPTTNNNTDRSDSETVRPETAATPDPDVVVPDAGDDGCSRCHGRRRSHGARGPHHPHSHQGPHRGGPGAEAPQVPLNAPFDLSALLRTVGNHPLVQSLREQFPEPTADAAGAGAGADASANTDTNNNDSGNSTREKDTGAFTPPVDIFNTETAYILHLALPGARKDDVSANWDGESRTLHVTGVVHRPGDEAFLATLQGTGERTVGYFERKVALPGNDEVDGMAVSGKMEDGILVVTVPKVEKEWTEIHKVDIM